jgi:hypothetical protein
VSIIEFLSAFGLGAIVTTLIQAYLSNLAYVSKRNFDEKKESFVGFLDAMHRSEIERSDEAAKNVGHWQNRIELVGSQAVVRCCIAMTETNPTKGVVHPNRPRVLIELKEAKRKDLGVTKFYLGEETYNHARAQTQL